MQEFTLFIWVILFLSSDEKWNIRFFREILEQEVLCCFLGPMVRIPPFQGGGRCSIHRGCICFTQKLSYIKQFLFFGDLRTVLTNLSLRGAWIQRSTPSGSRSTSRVEDLHEVITKLSFSSCPWTVHPILNILATFDYELLVEIYVSLLWYRVLQSDTLNTLKSLKSLFNESIPPFCIKLTLFSQAEPLVNECKSTYWSQYERFASVGSFTSEATSPKWSSIKL